MKPEKFGPLATYGNKDIFEKRLDEGYSKIAFGRGKWIKDCKIEDIFVFKTEGIFVFFHPEGKIATYEHSKQISAIMSAPDIHDISGGSIPRTPFEKEYTKEEFQEYREKQKIKLSGEINLETIVKYWKGGK